MGDDDDEGTVRRRLFQEAVPAAALAAAGQRIGGPAGAALAVGLSPYAREFFGKVLSEFGEDARRRASEMMMSAGNALAYEPGELADLAAGSERARLLSATATFGAAQTTWPPKVRALGRVLADGLIAKDDAKIDVTNMALAAMSEMERPHVSLLELLVCYVPSLANDHWTSAPYSPKPSPLGESGLPGDRAWSARAIFEVRPQLAPAFLGLIETLVRHALVFERDRTTEAFRKFIISQAAYQRRVADRFQRNLPALPDFPGVPDAPPQWSPTEFGEQVLGYYREAGRTLE
jgi:hypothetical protein